MIDVDFGLAPEGVGVNLFEVINTSSKRILLIARSEDRAFQIANCAKHIRWSDKSPRWKIEDNIQYSRYARKINIEDRIISYHSEICQTLDNGSIHPKFIFKINQAIIERRECTIRMCSDAITIGKQVTRLEELS